MPPKTPPGLEQIVARGPQGPHTPTHLLTKSGPSDPEIVTQQPVAYEEWMAKTALDWKHPRSGRLKRIDSALKAADKMPTMENMRELRKAINDWIRYKGVGNWKQSARNVGGIVERLRTWAFAPDLPTPMSAEEVEAWKYIEEERKKALHKVFQGKHVRLKIMSAIMKGKDAASDVKDAAKNFKQCIGVLAGTVEVKPHHAPNLVSGVQAVGKGAGVVKDFVHSDLLDIKNMDLEHLKLVKDMIPLDQITTDFIPFVNIVTGAVGLLIKWGKVAQAARAVYKTENSRYTIELGDPQKAFDGLMKCLKRDRTSKALEASQASAKFALQTAGTFADMGAATGPAIAAANAAATLAHKLFLFGREVKEVRKANKILGDPDNLDFKLFESYPLAGCYMIRCADLSDIIAMSTVQFGNPGWMDDIEDMKKKYIDPMIKHCDRFIKDSLFEIPNMPKMPSDEMKEKAKMAKKAMKGKTLTGISSTDYFAQHP
jgi:hypothetical protein